MANTIFWVQQIGKDYRVQKFHDHPVFAFSGLLIPLIAGLVVGLVVLLLLFVFFLPTLVQIRFSPSLMIFFASSCPYLLFYRS